MCSSRKASPSHGPGEVEECRGGDQAADWAGEKEIETE